MSKKKRNILVLSSWYPNRLQPTLGNFNEKFSQAIAIYHEVFALHVVADAKMLPKEEIIFSEIKGVKTLHIYFKKAESENIFNKIIKAFRFLKYYIKGFRLIKEKMGKPEIIHLNILYPVGFIAFIFKFIYNIPYIITENWTGYLPSHRVYQGAIIEFLSQQVAKNAACLVPVTQNLKENMQKLGFDNRYEIVPNVTDVKHFYPKKNKDISGKKIILHVSTLDDAHKNISGILRVIEKLQQERNDFEMHIVGDGDANPHKEYASKLGIKADYLKFFGEMSPEQVADKMRNSHLFVLFSNYENLPCVMVEAFASGLPVVSTSAGGVAEHLSIDKGIVIAPKDENALYESIKKVLNNLEIYEDDNLHHYAVDYFSYESVGNRFTEIYSSILD